MAISKKDILQKRFSKLAKHVKTLSDYQMLIDGILKTKDIYNPKIFEHLMPQELAILDAYLKRFSAIQDFLGAKILPMLFESAGIPSQSMSETLYHAVKEGIIDSLENWVELRDVRNDLEHDYPDEITETLKELKFCIDHCVQIIRYCEHSQRFFIKMGN